MTLFRLIFILLGLCLCLNHVWCLTCGTEYDDPASKAYIADIVIIGKLSQKLPSKLGLYNATIKISKKGNILKGSDIMRPLLKRRAPRLLSVGKFGSGAPELCVTELEKEREYIMFLNTTADPNFFLMSGMPVSNEKKKTFRKAKKDVRKAQSGVKIPNINPSKMKDRRIDEGERITLTCRLKGKTFPLPVFEWLKDGTNIQDVNPKAAIKSGKKSSRLTIRRARQEDAGTYTCVVRNVGGENRHDAVIKIRTSKPSATVPEPGDPALGDVEVDFHKELKLVCKIKEETDPATSFKWFKDGSELKTGDRGAVIRYKRTESTLLISKVLQTDRGVYICKADNGKETVIQKANVSILGAPKKKVPCTEEEATFCLNGGTCEKFVEIGGKTCTCKPGYNGERCMELTFDKIQEQKKLAQDRTIVVVGIIGVILLFIIICVASYVLAKRQRDRFHKQRSQRENGNIEDNIPQVYPPLPCDETDGHIKKTIRDLIHKEVQTIETCFINSAKQNLYISPFESYVNEGAGDRNSRSRRTAVSVDGDPGVLGPESDEENNRKPKYKGDVATRRDRPVSNASRHSNNGLNFDGAPNDQMNDLSPKRKSMQNDTERPVKFRPKVVNIPSPKSQVPIINLDSDSEEDFPVTDSLPTLHITDEEDDNDNAADYIFKKCKLKPRPKSSNSEIRQEKIDNTKDKDKKVNTDHDGKENKDRDRKETKDRERKDNKNNVLDRKESGNRGQENHKKREQLNKTEQSTKPPKQNEQRTSSKPFNQPVQLTVNTKASTNNDSDSSTTTEGCDSPNTAWRNAQEDLSDLSPTDHTRTNWNERGSPEHNNTNADNMFNIFPKMEKRHTSSDRNRNDTSRNKHNKNKYTIVI